MTAYAVSGLPSGESSPAYSNNNKVTMTSSGQLTLPVMPFTASGTIINGGKKYYMFGNDFRRVTRHNTLIIMSRYRRFTIELHNNRFPLDVTQSYIRESQ